MPMYAYVQINDAEYITLCDEFYAYHLNTAMQNLPLMPTLINHIANSYLVLNGIYS